MIPGESVGGVVNCLLIRADLDKGRPELRGGSVKGAQLQRIASRCHCSVIYVSYGGQAEAEACETPHAIISVSVLSLISILHYRGHLGAFGGIHVYTVHHATLVHT